MVVVGLDPSFRCTGMAAVWFPRHEKPDLMSTAEANGAPLAKLGDRERIDTVVFQVQRFLDTLEGMVDGANERIVVDLVGIEMPFENYRNPSTFGRLIRLGEAIERGVEKKQIVRVAPAQVKLALAGHGRAKKDQMVRAAERELNVVLPGNRAGKEARADAIGVAMAAYGRFRETGISGVSEILS